MILEAHLLEGRMVKGEVIRISGREGRETLPLAVGLTAGRLSTL